MLQVKNHQNLSEILLVIETGKKRDSVKTRMKQPSGLRTWKPSKIKQVLTYGLQLNNIMIHITKEF